MKNLKLILVVAIAFFSMQATAQVKFGVKAGLNMNNIAQNFADSDGEEATKMNFGFNIGLAVEYGLSDAMSIQTGLQYTAKGYKSDLEDGLQSGESVDGYDKYTFNYLEVPIHFAYKMDAFQIYAGPFVAFGIGGKNKWDATFTDASGDYKSEGEETYKGKMGEWAEADLDGLGDDETPYNSFDYGLNFGVGYTVGPILINAGYSLGLGNLSPKINIDGFDYDAADYKTSTRVISVSVSYFFGE